MMITSLRLPTHWPPSQIETRYSSEDIEKIPFEIISHIKKTFDCCIDQDKMVLIMENEKLWNAIKKLKNKVVRARFVTSVNEGNIATCKQLMKIGEVFHNDGVKCSFQIVDETNYLGMKTGQTTKYRNTINYSILILNHSTVIIVTMALIVVLYWLDKISPLRTTKKLGAILFQLPPSFTVNDFKNIEQFLDKLPTSDGYDYAVEFRHPPWRTEGPWEMLRHYTIAAVMTDSPPSENLQFLSDVIITANQSFIRFHGRNTKGHYWYNYLYSEQELKAWVEKVNQIREQTKILRIYFNNHYGGKAVVNAMQFKEISLSADERKVLENTHRKLVS